MKPFMDKDFLLETETAKHLFHDYSDPMSLVDYHCHISPKEIYEDRRFNNIAEVWLGGENPDGTYFGDHYKWRVMRSNGTPDDPIDSLEWHEKIAADPSIEVKVCPSYRPDKAININKEGFAEYIGKLAASVGKKELASAQEVIDALIERLEFFAKLGCRASDHGLDYIPFRPAPMEEVDAIYKKVMAGGTVTVEEAEKYQTAVLMALGKAYHRLNIAMQLHYSCYRNANERIFRKMGPDTGVDMIAQNTCGEDIARMLSALDMTNECPKTIIYSLNPADNEQIGTMLGCFQSDEVPGKIQHGSAWWFNDTKSGMEDQMRYLANLGLLGNFIGMLTDSRSFLSYARHDYFRRIMCNLIGSWVENGEYPNNEASLKKIVEGISYTNAARYFGL